MKKQKQKKKNNKKTTKKHINYISSSAEVIMWKKNQIYGRQTWLNIGFHLCFFGNNKKK